MMTPTPKFRPAASVLLVNIDDALQERIAAAILPVQVLRVGHASAAVERMLATQPLVVIVGRVPHDDLAGIEERSVAIGAELVLVDAFASVGELVLHVVSGMLAAEQRRGGVFIG